MFSVGSDLVGMNAHVSEGIDPDVYIMSLLFAAVMCQPCTALLSCDVSTVVLTTHCENGLQPGFVAMLAGVGFSNWGAEVCHPDKLPRTSAIS